MISFYQKYYQPLRQFSDWVDCLQFFFCFQARSWLSLTTGNITTTSTPHAKLFNISTLTSSPSVSKIDKLVKEAQRDSYNSCKLSFSVCPHTTTSYNNYGKCFKRCPESFKTNINTLIQRTTLIFCHFWTVSLGWIKIYFYYY